MTWIPLSTQFCLELAFGVLVGLAFLSRAPLGLFFHRMMGATAGLPLLAAAVLGPGFGGAAWTTPTTLFSCAALVALPWVSGPVRSSRRFVAVMVAALATGLALVAAVRGASGVVTAFDWTLGSLMAMTTGIVAGGVGLAMVVGHWYLTVPDLPVSLLARLNRLTAWAMLACAALLVLTCFVHADVLSQRTPAGSVALLSPFGLFFLSTRIAVGLALPLLFAWMTAGSLRYRNTRSATGILYASTVLVLIGAAVSLSLQDSYGIPL